MRFRFLRSPLLSAVAVASTLMTAGALAQQAPPEPADAGARAMRPAGRPDSGTASSVVAGRIQRWLVNPNGDVDGLLLADGTQVGFPPHLSADMTAAFKVGDNVEVTGWRAPNVPVVRAASLSAPGGGRRVVDQPPAAGARPPQPREPRALTAMNAGGRVDRMLYTDRGDINGLLLDSGTIVRFPPRAGADAAGVPQPGGAVQARGWGTRGADGTAIEATALGTSQGDMRELFAGPGKAPRPSAGPAPGPGPAKPRAPKPDAVVPAPAS